MSTIVELIQFSKIQPKATKPSKVELHEGHNYQSELYDQLTEI